MNSREHHYEYIAIDDREYRCRFEPETDAGYQVTSLDMPPLLAFGDTLEDARANIREELLTYAGADERYDPHLALRAEWRPGFGR
jgi:predicted RNase H-like HicB family nuclease